MNLNVVGKTIKLLEENTGVVNLYNLGFGKGFLGMISKL